MTSAQIPEIRMQKFN